MIVILKCRQCGKTWELDRMPIDTFLSASPAPNPFKWIHKCEDLQDGRRKLGFSDPLGYVLSKDQVTE